MTGRSRSMRVAAAAGVVAAGLLTLPSSSSVADEDAGGRYPGLPFMACPADPPESDYDPCLGTEDGLDKYGWINSVSVGRTGSTTAKQWARIPLLVMANNVAVGNKDAGNGGIYDDYLIRNFLVSPKGSDHNYGISHPSA